MENLSFMFELAWNWITEEISKAINFFYINQETSQKINKHAYCNNLFACLLN